MQNLYESTKLLGEYLLLHYGAEDALFEKVAAPRDGRDFPVRCVHDLIDAPRLKPGARALDLGCSVGRSSFELCRYCDNVLSIDLSESFIRAARQMREAGVLSFEVVMEGDLGKLVQVRLPDGLDRGRARFETGDAMNLPADLGRFDLVLAANLVCRLPKPRAFLRRLPDLVNPGGQLLMTTPFTWLEEFTPRAEWLGGRREEGVRSDRALQEVLDPDFELQLTKNLPFLIREHERKFQYGVALGWRWVRR